MNITKGVIGNALTSAATDHVVAVANDIYDEVLNKYQSEINADIKSKIEALPDKITKEDVGLGNVDNTSDNAKPVSLPQKTFIINTIQSRFEQCVSKEEGKGLSSNDYTTEDKSFVDSIKDRTYVDISNPEATTTEVIIETEYKTSNGGGNERLVIPSATTEKAGVVTAEDKILIDTITNKADESELFPYTAEKVLDDNNFEEITPITREQLRKDTFIDLWNKACIIDSVKYGEYNPVTGFFELNGLTDITYEQALAIYVAPRIRADHDIGTHGLNSNDFLYLAHQIRTNMPFTCKQYYPIVHYGCFVNHAFEVFNGLISVGNLMFKNAVNLKRINIGVLAHSDKGEGYNAYGDCKNLEHIDVKTINKPVNIDLSSSPKLDLETFRNIANATIQSVVDAGGYNIKVHDDVYNKLFDETNTEWYQVLGELADKSINILA